MAKSVIFIPGIAGSDLYVPNPNNNSQTFGGASPAAGKKVFLTKDFMEGTDQVGSDALSSPTYTLSANQLIQDDDISLLGHGFAPGYTKTTSFFRDQKTSSGDQIWSIRTKEGLWKSVNESAAVADSTNVFFEYPYDWRIDIRQHAYELNYFISQYILGGQKLNAGSDIYLIGHSTGGLISRAYLSDKYLQDPNQSPSGGKDPWTNGATLNPFPQNSVKAQILIATPSHGAPKAYRVLRTGTGFQFNDLGLSSHGPPNQQGIVGEMQLVYQLLPDNQYGVYFDQTKGGDYRPLVTCFYDSEPTIKGTYLQSESKLNAGKWGNVYALDGGGGPVVSAGSVSTLVNNALSFHDDLGYDTFLPGQTYAFYSDRMQTPTGLWFPDPDAAEPQDVGPYPLYDKVGDGTVPAKSVYDLSDFTGHSGFSGNIANDQPSPNIFDYPSADILGINFDPTKNNLVCMGSTLSHTDLPSDPNVLNMVLQIINQP